jgi:hypothetical protein
MKKELWLETGTIQGNDYHDMHWYNEGNFQELPQFFKQAWNLRKTSYAYAFMRWGKKRIYILKRN